MSSPDQPNPIHDLVINSVEKASPTPSITKSIDVNLKEVPDDLADHEDPHTSLTDWLFRRNKHKKEPDAIATRRSVFDDPHLAPHYMPKSDYENLHRFDINARWTVREERELVRKIDIKVLIWAVISFSALNLDRSNISQANSDNFLPELHMTTDDYNWGNSIFRLAFLAAELPSQLVSKRVGPDRWIPTQICLWSIVTICQFWLSGRTSFFITRALLGFLQGGYIPDLILYLSYFYTKTELPLRLTFFWMSLNLVNIIASFLAYGILHLDGRLGYPGWAWLFLIEGLLTLVIGIITFFRMPPSPTQTKAWFRPKGWFNEREETIMVSRILRDDPSKGDMHNREGLTPKRLWIAVCDYDLWPIYFIGLMFGLPQSTPQNYLTLSLRNLGFNTFNTNLLTIPSTAIGIVMMFIITLISEAISERTIVSMMEDLWILPFIIAIYAQPKDVNPWMFFGLATGLLSYPYTHPIQVAWASRNAGAVASRTVNASLYNMMVQLSAVVSSQIYQASDAPQYKRGNLALIIITVFNVTIMYPGTKLYYIWKNKKRDRIWNAMTPEEKAEYLKTTKDLGNRRLDFRFAH